jgi:hypothetical protein
VRLKAYPDMSRSDQKWWSGRKHLGPPEPLGTKHSEDASRRSRRLRQARGPFGVAQGRLFDSHASRKRDACFAQDDRCWVRSIIQRSGPGQRDCLRTASASAIESTCPRLLALHLAGSLLLLLLGLPAPAAIGVRLGRRGRIRGWCWNPCE